MAAEPFLTQFSKLSEPPVLAERRGWARWHLSPPRPAVLSAPASPRKSRSPEAKVWATPGSPEATERHTLFPAARPSQEGCHLKSQRIVVSFLVRRLTGKVVVS